ncbi:hypothetical protein GCM10010359_27880 [Streptomyces morookaense]|uniref:MgtC/SapB family protein n=2 Tax=Streptomyces morookaense TaxID=1970 RepID=A0A7Y7B147_STRMO|nr:MgtC/SapB family protein [Streptomyces morookaense]NVK77113.1 MgtC/SapB family protein [Streptomyces morookaense]GHF24077.1 hypothetical protein GCM10010359_27880 [Streptomyces morookaense]
MADLASVMEPAGESWLQVVEFLEALLLSGVIGIERQLRHKAAGLRTYTTVGSAAAVFMLVSKYGFTDVLHLGTVVLDPSRVAAQIVSGLGFIGAGVIFVHRGSVQGLTTAATIWLTAAVGAAAAAGLPLLAALAVVAYLAVSYVLRPVLARLPSPGGVTAGYRIAYLQGRGLLRELLDRCTQAGFAVHEVRTLSGPVGRDSEQVVEISLVVQGRGDAGPLTARLAAVPGVLVCRRTEPDGE